MGICCRSLQCVGEVDFLEHSPVLLESNSEAVQQVLGVSLSELGAIVEGHEVGVGLGMVFDGLDHVAESLLLQSLLGFDDMHIVEVYCDVLQAALVDVAGVHWVAHQPLVVWDWPRGGRHHSQRMVQIWINRSSQSVLSRESSLHLYIWGQR